jgi:hypothetical protein
MTKASIPPKDVKILWGTSAGKCSICRCDLIQDQGDGRPYPLGEMAHIEGENDGSARFNSQLSVADRAKYNNLILLCPTHHTIIDRDPGTYTVEKLRSIKNDHELFITESLKTNIADVTFAELDIILKYLTGIPSDTVPGTLTLIPLQQKIEKNSLSPEVQKLILMGLTQVTQVRTFIAKNPDFYYGERLRSGFVQQFRELHNQGLRGDSLFYPLWDFASTGETNFKIKAAGLSVLVYFFELCEVFSE